MWGPHVTYMDVGNADAAGAFIGLDPSGKIVCRQLRRWVDLSDIYLNDT